MASESAFRRPQQTRLQRRAPASIQTAMATNRGSQWNAGGAIPLLSPVSSPPAPDNQINTKQQEYHYQPNSGYKAAGGGGSVVYKKWQAAPFRYDSSSSSSSSSSRR